MIVERRSAPERLDATGEALGSERPEDRFAGREMERRFHVPGDGLSEALREMGQPEAGIAVPRGIANHQHATRRDPGGETLEQTHLIVRREVMEEVKEDNVAARDKRFTGVLFDEIEIVIATASR